MWNVSTFVLSFFIYSFIGYCCEVIYCSIPKKHFVNRGFLFGPYLPIYGSGAMVVLLLLEPFFDKWYLVFIFGLLSTSIIEYVTSYALEKIFKMKLWDYSNHPINIHGRVCELNSTLFGLMSLFLVYVANEPVLKFVNRFSDTTAQILSLIIVAIMSADCAFSVVKLASFRKAIAELSEAKAAMQVRLASVKELPAEAFAAVKLRIENEYEEKKAKYYRNMKRIMDNNPGLTAKTENLRYQLTLAKAMVSDRAEKYKADRKARKENR